jgi:hypothetical protein
MGTSNLKGVDPVGVTNHLPGAFVQTLQLCTHTDGGGNVGAARTADGGENGGW